MPQAVFSVRRPAAFLLEGTLLNLSEYLSRVRRQAPVIHAISNYVTANDVANLLLACGASPIMADDPEEAVYITRLSAALALNLGTLSRRRVSAMLAAGEEAGRLGRPVLLDPVGAGASPMRTDTARMLLHRLPVTALRCNASELRALLSGVHTHRGVDADGQDRQKAGGLSEQITFVKGAARQLGCLVAVTGETDLVSDGETCFVIRNGRPEMSRVTGTGCQLSALCAAFLAADPDRSVYALAAAVCAMGLAGEIAWGHMAPHDGNAAYRSRIIDAVYHLDGETLNKGARYELG